MEARFACGSVVLFDLFQEILAHSAKIS